MRRRFYLSTKCDFPFTKRVTLHIERPWHTVETRVDNSSATVWKICATYAFLIFGPQHFPSFILLISLLHLPMLLQNQCQPWPATKSTLWIYKYERILHMYSHKSSFVRFLRAFTAKHPHYHGCLVHQSLWMEIELMSTPWTSLATSIALAWEAFVGITCHAAAAPALLMAIK